MVVIRMSPAGKKGAIVYSLTVCEKGAKLTGKFIEKLGIFKPAKEKYLFELNTDRYNHWVKQGAQPSPRLLSTLQKYKLTKNTGTSAVAVAAPSAPAKKEAVKAAPVAAKKAPAKK